jgi:hypothetical protein
VTAKSGNLRNDLRKDILRAVSKLSKEFATLKSAIEDKNKLIVALETKAAERSTIIKALQDGEDSNGRGDHGATSLSWKVNSDSAWNVAAGRTRKCYSDVVADRQGNVPSNSKMYKLFVKSKNNAQNTPGPYQSQK